MFTSKVKKRDDHDHAHASVRFPGGSGTNSFVEQVLAIAMP